jgi:HlyD family secretion protein
MDTLPQAEKPKSATAAPTPAQAAPPATPPHATGVLAWIAARRGKLIVAVIAVALVIFAAVRWWRGPEVVVDRVVRRDFVQSVVASGRVETPNRVEIGAQITGTATNVPVIEGQRVKAGDLLVELQSAELQAGERQADGALVQAQGRLRQLREVQRPVAEQTLRQALTNLENARVTLRRNEDLYQKGFVGAAALDDLRRTMILADAQVRSTRRQFETARDSGSDTALAKAGVAEAEANAEMARARTGYATIAAPVDGILIGRSVEVGDVVQPGKVLMTLSPAGRTQLVAAIDERNLRLIAVGQKALASADAYPKQKFAAVLAYINPGVNATTGAVEVKFDVDAPPAMLRQDMTVSIDIEIAHRTAALVAPVGTLHDADAPSPWVLRVEKGRAQKRPVKVGLRGGGFAEILDGVAAGDALVPAGATVVADGRMRGIAPVVP